MILAINPSDMTFVGKLLSRGSSEAARLVATQADCGRRRLRKTVVFGFAGTSVLNELTEVAEECSSSNWDGYGAAPVSRASLGQAYRFLDAMPISTPIPSIGAEPDGDVTLEWHRSLRRTLSVSIAADGELHYAALLGASKVYGTEPFFGEVPQAILSLIRRVVPHER
jgi:hypothetical protein